MARKKVRLMRKHDKLVGSMDRGNKYGMQVESKEADGNFKDSALLI